MADEKVVPHYPCVEFLGTGKEIFYENGQRIERVVDSSRFYQIRSIDDLQHVDQMREDKRWPVIGFYNLERIKEGARPDKRLQVQDEIRQIQRRLESLVRPPELVMAEQISEARNNAGKAQRIRSTEASA